MQAQRKEVGVQSQAPTKTIMFLFCTLGNKICYINVKLESRCVTVANTCYITLRFFSVYMRCIKSITGDEMSEYLHKNFVN